MMEERSIQFKPKSFLLLIALLLLLLLAWQIRSVLLMFFAALVVSAGVEPLVNKLNQGKIKRPLATLLVYLAFLLATLLVITLVFRQLNTQFVDLFSSLPQILVNFAVQLRNNIPVLGEFLPLDTIISEATNLGNLLKTEEIASFISWEKFWPLLGQTFSFFSSVFAGLVTGFTVLIMSAYLTQSREKLYSGLKNRLAAKEQILLQETLKGIHEKLGAWVRGELALMLFIGLLTFILVKLPGLFLPDYRLDDFALPIALIAGLLELLPMIGPLVTLLLASVLALGTTGNVGILAYIVVSFTILQNLESVFIVPVVMNKAVDLNPVVTILAIFAGFELGGIVGALIAVPLLLTVQVIVTNVWDYQSGLKQNGRKRS